MTADDITRPVPELVLEMIDFLVSAAAGDDPLAWLDTLTPKGQDLLEEWARFRSGGS